MAELEAGEQSGPIAYATPRQGVNPTWRLATLVIGGLGFAFCGGCFCLGVLIVTEFVPRMNTGTGVPLPLTSGQFVFAFVLGAAAAACFAAAIALTLAGLRFERIAH